MKTHTYDLFYNVHVEQTMRLQNTIKKRRMMPIITTQLQNHIEKTARAKKESSPTLENSHQKKHNKYATC